MDASVDAQLRADDVAFDASDAELLRAVDEHGSVSGATESLGRSRARALGRLEEIEGAFGTLVERERGGASGGGSQLTERAYQLLARFDRLRATLAGTANVSETVLTGEVDETDGELGLVDTEVGVVRALLVDRDALTPGASAQVSVRSDTVTIQATGDAPAGSATSARNRFRGTVVDVDRGESVARIAVDIGAAEPVTAVLTHESLDRLDLEPGTAVVASFKATATRAIAR